MPLSLTCYSIIITNTHTTAKGNLISINDLMSLFLIFIILQTSVTRRKARQWLSSSLLYRSLKLHDAESSLMWQPHTSCILITNLAALEIDFSIRAHAAPIARRGIEYCIIYSSDCWRKKCDINETQEVEGERAVRFFLCSALWSARARCREIWFSAGEHDSSVPRLKNVLIYICLMAVLREAETESFQI